MREREIWWVVVVNCVEILTEYTEGYTPTTISRSNHPILMTEPTWLAHLSNVVSHIADMSPNNLELTAKAITTPRIVGVLFTKGVGSPELSAVPYNAWIVAPSMLRLSQKQVKTLKRKRMRCCGKKRKKKDKRRVPKTRSTLERSDLFHGQNGPGPSFLRHKTGEGKAQTWKRVLSLMFPSTPQSKPCPLFPLRQEDCNNKGLHNSLKPRRPTMPRPCEYNPNPPPGWTSSHQERRSQTASSSIFKGQRNIPDHSKIHHVVTIPHLFPFWSTINPKPERVCEAPNPETAKHGKTSHEARLSSQCATDSPPGKEKNTGAKPVITWKGEFRVAESSSHFCAKELRTKEALHAIGSSKLVNEAIMVSCQAKKLRVAFASATILSARSQRVKSPETVIILGLNVFNTTITGFKWPIIAPRLSRTHLRSSAIQIMTSDIGTQTSIQITHGGEDLPDDTEEVDSSSWNFEAMFQSPIFETYIYSQLLTAGSIIRWTSNASGYSSILITAAISRLGVLVPAVNQTNIEVPDSPLKSLKKMHYPNRSPTYLVVSPMLSSDSGNSLSQIAIKNSTWSIGVSLNSLAGSVAKFVFDIPDKGVKLWPDTVVESNRVSDDEIVPFERTKRKNKFAEPTKWETLKTKRASALLKAEATRQKSLASFKEALARKRSTAGNSPNHCGKTSCYLSRVGISPGYILQTPAEWRMGTSNHSKPPSWRKLEYAPLRWPTPLRGGKYGSTAREILTFDETTSLYSQSLDVHRGPGHPTSKREIGAPAPTEKLPLNYAPAAEARNRNLAPVYRELDPCGYQTSTERKILKASIPKPSSGLDRSSDFLSSVPSGREGSEYSAHLVDQQSSLFDISPSLTW
ncbi:hypothetical protein CCUS01_14943 [Colletotrichum cuscutae]|uniref:Uncharacterized protein n=1 Tax=Colletotrichum cuscutae TaxID=1209917 RepID=A0AAI9Y5C2_9PEZI|nr:hypothetical protein CCUS01_14943 [Colletotrichum cuscutae]